ncbi:hypothetical protein AcW1_009903 [Taiwanofungus camphoratus]|nr:hypothetical protein AcW1_009903 [Antrodia cinnamomea]
MVALVPRARLEADIRYFSNFEVPSTYGHGAHHLWRYKSKYSFRRDATEIDHVLRFSILSSSRYDDSQRSLPIVSESRPDTSFNFRASGYLYLTLPNINYWFWCLVNVAGRMRRLYDSSFPCLDEAHSQEPTVDTREKLNLASSPPEHSYIPIN